MIPVGSGKTLVFVLPMKPPGSAPRLAWGAIRQDCHHSSTTAPAASNPQLQIPCRPEINRIRELHARLLRASTHTHPSSLAHVIKSYALSSSHLHKACLLFHQIEHPSLRIWNHLIRGFALGEPPNRAIELYGRMHVQGFSADHLTYVSLFKACSRVPDISHGKMFHVHAMKRGFESYLYVANSLIYMYCCCHDLVSASIVFDGIRDRDLVSWNSLICGYSQCRRYKEILGLFLAMRQDNVKADAVTMVKVILACSHKGNMHFAESAVKYIEENCIEIDLYLGNTLIDFYGKHGRAYLARQYFNRMSERNSVTWNAMITGYAKAGNLVEARKIFDEMPNRDVISWTSMIVGYSQANRFVDALKLFQDMMAAEVIPDEITVATVISACAHVGSLDTGQMLHDYIRQHCIKEDVCVGNALIDMYCKCGAPQKAVMVFYEMREKDSISWTSVISGLAVNGFADHALVLFSQMLSEGVSPTHGSFVGVLMACAHAGLVDAGLEFFESMVKVHEITPEMKHYGCIVDLLSRSGHLNRAYHFIATMPIEPDVVLWRILLSACKLHGDVVLAERVQEKLLQLDPSNSGNYVLLSSTFAAFNRWDEATEVRGCMEANNVLKPSGWSSTEAQRVND